MIHVISSFQLFYWTTRRIIIQWRHISMVESMVFYTLLLHRVNLVVLRHSWNRWLAGWYWTWMMEELWAGVVRHLVFLFLSQAWASFWCWCLAFVIFISEGLLPIWNDGMVSGSYRVQGWLVLHLNNAFLLEFIFTRLVFEPDHLVLLLNDLLL